MRARWAAARPPNTRARARAAIYTPVSPSYYLTTTTTLQVFYAITFSKELNSIGGNLYAGAPTRTRTRTRTQTQTRTRTPARTLTHTLTPALTRTLTPALTLTLTPALTLTLTPARACTLPARQARSLAPW